MKRILLIVALLCACSNVGPEFTLNQVKNRLTAYSIFFSNLAGLTFSEFSSYFQHLFGREFTLRMGFSALEIIRSKINTLFRSVYLIAARIAQKQMARTDALAIVARVQNPFSLWNFSEVNNPTKPVHQNGSLVDSELPISGVGRQSTNPKPAAIGFMHIFPEILFGFRACFVMTSATAKFGPRVMRGKYALTV